MTILCYEHPEFLLHDTGVGHPESAERLQAISKALAAPEFNTLQRLSAPLGTEAQVRLIHSAQHLQAIRRAIPTYSPHYLDADTLVSKHSEQVALRAVGAVCDAVDQIMQAKARRAFCAVRPPGHHAEPGRAMGFCLFNNVAIAAEYARRHYALQRIAIVDFDVHHGNGTQAAFKQQPQVMYISSHEIPHYPGTGAPDETGVGNIINIPLRAGQDGTAFRKKYQTIVFPALRAFKPELLLLSAGFDAHKDDPLGNIRLVEADYQWLTEELKNIAEQFAQGRIISVLEGGYDLNALGNSVAAHIRALC